VNDQVPFLDVRSFVTEEGSRDVVEPETTGSPSSPFLSLYESEEGAGLADGANILYNMDAQVDYLVTELQTQGYRHVNNILRRANVSLEEASDEVVYNYEIPSSILTPPDPEGRRRKLPRNHTAVKNKFEERRSFSRNALRAYRQSIPS
jgi:hypothetical protein